jgi:hypothetical protein
MCLERKGLLQDRQPSLALTESPNAEAKERLFASTLHHMTALHHMMIVPRGGRAQDDSKPTLANMCNTNAKPR